MSKVSAHSVFFLLLLVSSIWLAAVFIGKQPYIPPLVIMLIGLMLAKLKCRLDLICVTIFLGAPFWIGHNYLYNDSLIPLVAIFPFVLMVLGYLVLSVSDTAKNFLLPSLCLVSLVSSLVILFDFAFIKHYSHRADGFFEDANVAAVFTLLGVLAWSVTCAKCRFSRVVYYAGLFVFLLGLAAAFSRSAILLMVGAFIGQVLLDRASFGWRVSFNNLIFSAIVAAIAILLIQWFHSVSIGEGAGFSQSSVASLGLRIPIYMGTIELFSDFTLIEWLFGAGIGSFILLYPSVRGEFVSSGDFVHSDAIQILLEGGLLLFVVYALLFGWLLLSWIKVISSRDRLTNEAGTHLVITTVILAFSLVNYSIYVPVLAFLLGASLGYFNKPVAFSMSLQTHAKWLVRCLCIFYFSVVFAYVLYAVKYYIFEYGEKNTKDLYANIIASLDAGEEFSSTYILMGLLEATGGSGQQEILLDYGLRVANDYADSRPLTPLPYYYRAYFLNRMGEENLAIDNLRIAVTKDPGFISGYTMAIKYGNISVQQEMLKGLLESAGCWLRHSSSTEINEFMWFIIELSNELGINDERYSMLVRVWRDEDPARFWAEYKVLFNTLGCGKYRGATLVGVSENDKRF